MYAKKLNKVLSLRLCHEKPDQQFFEYIGCHADTVTVNLRGAQM